jgi:hypothetical protein
VDSVDATVLPHQIADCSDLTIVPTSSRIALRRRPFALVRSEQSARVALALRMRSLKQSSGFGHSRWMLNEARQA